MSKNKSRRCPHIRTIQNDRLFSSGNIPKWSFLVIMTAALVVTSACVSLVPRLWKNSCLLENSNFVQDLFRPIVDCWKICGNLRKIDRLKNLPMGGGSIFQTEYLSQGRPVVIEDALQNWTALESFNLEFFVYLYLEGGKKLYVDDDRNCQFFRYRTNFSSLIEALKTLKQNTRLRNNFYIGWRNCDPVISEILKVHYSKPYFLPEYSESTGADWIFMGTKGSGAKLHVDKVTFSSWQAQIKGQKLWTLRIPPECYLDCPTSRFEVLLSAGDTIVVNTNIWYHKTEIIGNDLSISIVSEFD